MKKNVRILFLTALLVSCEKERSFDTDSNGDYIIMSANTKQTKGTAIETIGELPYFNVLAYYHKGLWENLSSSNQPIVYMNNVTVEKKGGAWVYSPLASWSKTGLLSFLCYYPSASPQNGITVTQPVDGSLPQLTYTVPEVVEDQPDLMVSTNDTFNLNRENNSSTRNFSLQHALTCLSLKASGNGELITAVKISGVVAGGTMSLGKPVVQWNLDQNDTNRTFSAGVNDQILDPTPSSILNSDGLLMMLPQTLSDAATLTITIDDGDKVYDRSFALKIPGYDVWRAGAVMEYNFSISSMGAIILNPAQITLQSNQGASSIFAIIAPQEAESSDWSISTDVGGWLQISDSPDGVNTDALQTDPYNYSGRGSKLLYVYAGSDNSGTGERVSQVTMTPGRQQIQVSQLVANSIYKPEVSDGWAGSNVYWVVDNSQPEGGRLTFSDRGDVSKEGYQGVYFMWGSLVALSPMGINWTGQILHIPNTNPATNGGWDTSNKEWGYIPRMGWSNSSNPNNGGSAVAVKSNLEQNYLYQNHDAKRNIGDICKYITDRGWAPGVEQGRKWRMVTHDDYNKIKLGLMEKRGVSTAKYSANAYGQEVYGYGFEKHGEVSPLFLPTGGFRDDQGKVDTYAEYRPGESFLYWLSSPSSSNNTGEDPLYYWLGVNGLVLKQSFGRHFGGTVRCVEER